MGNRAGAPFVVIGNGPVALACALLRARESSVRLLIPTGGSKPLAPRLEVVPSATLALLVDIGVHPHSVGVHEMSKLRRVAWDAIEPVRVSGHEAAHLERPMLETVLLSLVLRNRYIEVTHIDRSRARRLAQSLTHEGAKVIDATGRRSVTAETKLQPRLAWVARIFDARRRASRKGSQFMIAAHSEGYVYRIEGEHRSTVGLVGRGPLMRLNSQGVVAHLQGSLVSWIVDDLAPSDWNDCGAWPASPQCSQGSTAIPIGDAALARDPLSSQGLANGLSDACHAARISTVDDEIRVRERNEQARRDHFRALAETIGTCFWREAPTWRQYHVALEIQQNCICGSPIVSG